MSPHGSTPAVAMTGKNAGFTPKPNIALYCTKDHRVYTKEIPYPTPKDDECVVHVQCTGICGSEIHFWKTGGIGDYLIEEDLRMGHEAAGVIVSVGPDVKSGLKPGDRVSIEPGYSCRACNQCSRGRYNLCPDMQFCATPPVDGTLARYIAWKGDYLFKIPDSMSMAAAALVEPISVGLAGVQRANLRLGQPVLVCGSGPIGLVSLALARAAGAFPIVVTDVDPAKLEWATKLGADAVYQVPIPGEPRAIGKEIRAVFDKICPGVQPEVALECTGIESSFFGASFALQDGGMLMQIGNGHMEQQIPFQSLSMREIDVHFIFRYVNTWPLVIRMLQGNKLPGVEDMVTHTFPLEDAVKAFEAAIDPNVKNVKIQIVDM